jgi:hypothetical protein
MSRQASGNQQQLSPERVPLRRPYFLNPEHFKFVFLGFYPYRGHRAFFGLGCARRAPLFLPSTIVPTLALHLPKLCKHLARSERYKCNETSFRM